MTKNLQAFGLVSIDAFATWAACDPDEVREEIRHDNLTSVEIDGVTFVRLADPKAWRDAWLKRQRDAADGCIYSIEL